MREDAGRGAAPRPRSVAALVELPQLPLTPWRCRSASVPQRRPRSPCEPLRPAYLTSSPQHSPYSKLSSGICSCHSNRDRRRAHTPSPADGSQRAAISCCALEISLTSSRHVLYRCSCDGVIHWTHWQLRLRRHHKNNWSACVLGNFELQLHLHLPNGCVVH